MSMTFDRNLFEQIGLDSGSLTMLGAVIHSFREPGEYRGTVHRGEEVTGVFYLSVDRESPVAQVNIDLASLDQALDTKAENCECESSHNRFTVNPKGYAVFHVSHGPGQYYVHVRRAVDNQDEAIFDSRQLSEGDIFSAIIIRPGVYSVINTHNRSQSEIVVSYPQMEQARYRAPSPARVQTMRASFESQRVELKPGQGLLFECQTSSRIQIELQQPDDGPGHPLEDRPRGWRKNSLPEPEA